MDEPGFNLLEAQRRVFESSLSTPEKITALALLDHWSRAGRVFPSIARLARLTSQHRTTVIRAIATLEAREAIRSKRSCGRATDYDITPLLKLPVAESDQSQRATGSTERPNQSHRATPPVAQSDPKEPSKGSKKEPRSRAPKNGAAHQRVTGHYFEAFEAARGSKPVFDGADGTAVNTLLKKFKGDAEAACRVISSAYADPFKASHATIRTIAKDPAKYQGSTHIPRNGALGAPQMGLSDRYQEGSFEG